MGAIIIFGRNLRSTRGPWMNLTGEDMDSHDLGYTRLDEMVQYAVTLGIPASSWPNYVDTALTGGIIPAEEVRTKSAALRAMIARIPLEQIGANPTLWVVAEHLALGRDAYFYD